MSLLDAKEYDPRPAKRMWRLIGLAVALAIAWFIFWFFPIIPWLYRYGSEERAVGKFLHAIEAKDFEKAYGVYVGDPDWKQHPERHTQPTFNQFALEWGPSGDYGAITSHTIDCATEPDKKGFASPSGVIVVATINGRSEGTSLWVEKKTRTITTSPFDVQCHPPK